MPSTLARLPRRRTAALVAAVAALPALALALRANTAQAAVSCPGAPGLPFTAELTNGDIAVGSLVKSSGNSVKACGGAAVTNGQLSTFIAKENISFPPSTFKVLILDVPTRFTAVSDMTGPITIDSTGAYHETFSGMVSAEADILGSTCTIPPFRITFTTDRNGSLEGQPLVDDGTGTVHGRFVAGDFEMPAMQSSATCNGLIAGLSNFVMGLPNKPGAATAAFDGTVVLR